MKTTHISLALYLFFCCSFLTHAQKTEMGKVTIADLQEKKCPTDTAAVAAILFKKARTYFVYTDKNGFSLNHEYTYRIKIYKKEGLDWANFRVSYYVGYENINADRVEFSDGITYNLENGTIEKTKLKSEGNFKNTVNEYWNEASISMPNVKVGSIVEFHYTLKSENTVKFPVFTFQSEIPVKYAIYTTEIPEYYFYKPILKGFLKVNMDSKVVNGFQNFMNEHNQTVNLSYLQVNTQFYQDNIPAIHKEDFVDNIDNYKSAVVHELEKTKFPDVPEKMYSKSWQDVAFAIYKDKYFGNEINLKGYFEQDLKEIIKKDTSEIQKANTIFKFVQNKMNWNAVFGYDADKGVKKAYLEGSGNIADINFILIAMLNYAGINANPVLTSTVDHGVPVFPNRTVFNYVLAAADIDGKRMLFDATNKYTSVNILPLHTLNWTGRLVRSDGTSDEIDLIPKTPSRTNINLLVSVDETGKISGKYRKQKTDYEALQFRENWGTTSTENYLEKLDENWPGIQINDYVIQNKQTDLSKPVAETFGFTISGQIESIGDKLYMNPLLFFTLDKNPFYQEKRELPIYFGYPKHSKYNVTIDLPKGYTVESVPKSITITTNENMETFVYNIVALDSKIQVSSSLENNGTLLSASFYSELKEFFQKVVAKENEKIILKRIP